MRNKEILDALSKRANELESNFDKLSVHDVQLLKLMRRICYVLVESEIINIPMRIEALIATQGYLVTQVKKLEHNAGNEVIAFVWHNMKTLTSQEVLAEVFEIRQDRIARAYLDWLGSSKMIAA